MTAQEKYEAIKNHLEIGGQVLLCTYGHATKLSKKHIPQLKVSGNSLLVQSGKNWLCHDYSAIRFSK